MKNETAFGKKLIERLEEEVGGFWWKVHGGMFQIAGIQDWCGCVRGLYIAIELKFGKGKVKKVQETRHKQVIEAGGLSFACWEYQLEWAVKKVKKYVEKHALQGTKPSRKIIRKKKADRIIHGARDWEDHYKSRLSGSKTKKKR